MGDAETLDLTICLPVGVLLLTKMINAAVGCTASGNYSCLSNFNY